MSVRPLDVTLTVQRAPEVNRNQTNEGVRQDIMGQHTMDSVKKEVQFQDQNVTQTNKTEENNVNRDGKGNGAYGGDSGKKGRKKETEGKPSPREHTGMLDVSI